MNLTDFREFDLSLRTPDWAPITRPGYVYIIRAENGLFKIGKAKSPKARIAAIGQLIPMKWEVFHIFWSPDFGDAERSLHQYYASKRIIGEWFALNEHDAEHVKNCPDGTQ
jgi:predicted GIY-YIG superfamily endonuclease